MKETKTTYAYLVEHMTEPSFDKVRSIACDFVHKLPLELVDELHEMLNRGVEALDSEPLMQMYFYSYGCMHSEKLAFAFQKLNSYIKSAKIVDLIDYGCGQGLATMCYHDFIVSNGLQQQVRSITLIEPSSAALARAELLGSRFFPNAVITSIQKSFDELQATDVQIMGDIPTLHLFSNVLDVESFDVTSLSNFVKFSCRGDNEFVIVSPMQNTRKLERIKEFVRNIGANCYFEKYLEKQQLRKDKDWTCSAILCSTRDEKFAELNLNNVYKKIDKFFNNLLLWRDKDYAEKVFAEVQLCANNGDAKCMNAVGCFCNNGIVVEKDFTKALKWFEKASKNGYLPATYNVAIMYANGDGIDKNIEIAIEIANKLQSKSPILFNATLGKIFQIDKKTEVAFKYYKEAAKLGDSDSQYYYGRRLCKGDGCKRDVKLGYKYIRSAAKKGSPEANYIMARLYEFGFDKVGIEQSDSLAVRKYKMAAERGIKKAQLKLAKIYEEGLLGVKKNKKESFKWYLLLAESGDNNAAFKVAYSYRNGSGVNVNYEEAVKWYKIAADNGSVAAMNNLAICYEYGEGVESDLKTAFSLYYKAANLGNLVAANNLSNCYQSGTGTQINPQEALIWKTKVANANNTKAQKTLAEWYFKGYGTCRNREKALYWYAKSTCCDTDRIKDINDSILYIKEKANEEDALFQYLLAKCYDYGIGLQKNKQEAALWYKSSAENGFVESLIKLHLINSLSTKVNSEELENGITDEFGVKYSHDWKKVLSCSFAQCECYTIRKGTRIIADETFRNQWIKKVVIPSSIVKIGDNPFVRDSRYNNHSIKIENYSPNYITKGCALYSRDGDTMIAYWGSGKHFVVPRSVKHIGNACFSNSISLETITFPEGLKSIGKKAFMDCYSLQSIDLPPKVSSIGESAFWGCEHLENVWSLGAIERIEANTFKGCNLKYIHFPTTLKSIGESAFNNNIELKDVELPDSVEKLENFVFAYCYKLERINLGESVRQIGDFCFFECAIKEIRLPSSLIHLGTRPFYNVESIITKPNCRFISNGGLLKNKKTKNLECYFGNESSLTLTNIKSISPFAFYNSKVENVIIPESINTISEYTFYKANNVKSISLPNKLETIEVGAFYGCENLAEISIPKSVKEVQRSSFAGCFALKCILFEGRETKASESIIIQKKYNGLPSAYRSHKMTIGSIITENLTYNKSDVESLEFIKVIVPPSSKNNYTFNPVFSVSDFYAMERRFKVIEHNENS